MRTPTILAALAALLMLCSPPPAAAQGGDAVVGGYILLSRARNGQVVGLDELQLLARQAATLPVNRVWLAFVSPTMVYEAGSNTLQYTGLNVSTAADYGFAEIQKSVAQLQAGGVEVFLSMGGWNYNCFPYLYARYSVGGYGPNTPNYWKINKYGNGNVVNCVADNQFCYVCEPPSEGTSLADFTIFPEPFGTPTWESAAQYIASKAGGSQPPQWDKTMVPGRSWTDAKTGISVTVPGSDLFVQKNRDPYQDLVYLAKDLGVAGIDLDYEEFWHGDYYKIGSGPWELPQTVYKYSAIVKDLALNIQQIAPALKLSTAAGAVGAWQGNWWGGNLKGVWYFLSQWYPDLSAFLSTGPNAGGINVMTYDLSDNDQFHECPQDGVCELDQQVAFYMNTYKQANIVANVGYEVGTPAYPDPTQDKAHQLPLTKAKLQTIVSATQGGLRGGFLWELFKGPDAPENASPTDVAQAVCASILKAPRCSGTIPNITAATAASRRRF